MTCGLKKIRQNDNPSLSHDKKAVRSPEIIYCDVTNFCFEIEYRDDIIDEEDSIESANTFNKMLSRWAVAFFALRSYLNKKSLCKNGNQNNM